ncbi:MAG: MlaA family lipoprotein [Janthinobacterium lividum]
MFFLNNGFINFNKIKKLWFAVFFSLLTTDVGCCSWLTSSDSLNTLSDEHIDGTLDVEDPMEDVNRSVFRFNQLIDAYFAKPITDFYKDIFPKPVQESVHNFVNNINAPVIFINDVLQFEGDRAMDTLARFVINTTLGGLGLFDVAHEWFDINYHEEDFGETLGHYGVGDSCYLVIPFIGPSNPRDLTGVIFDLVVDPVDALILKKKLDYLIYVRWGVEGIDKRVEADSVLEQINRSPDPYIAMRSAYTQNRAFNINKGVVDNDSPVPFEEDESNMNE